MTTSSQTLWEAFTDDPYHLARFVRHIMETWPQTHITVVVHSVFVIGGPEHEVLSHEWRQAK